MKGDDYVIKKTHNKDTNSFKNYMKETKKNKLYALALFALGLFSSYVVKDATFLIFMSLIAIPLFFVKENCIFEKEEES